MKAFPADATLSARTGRWGGGLAAGWDSSWPPRSATTYPSAVLLLGLVLNSTLGWSWADPLAALVIAAVAVHEGVAAWRGDTCCVPPVAILDAEAAPSCSGDDGCSDRSGRTPGHGEPQAASRASPSEGSPWE